LGIFEEFAAKSAVTDTSGQFFNNHVYQGKEKFIWEKEISGQSGERFGKKHTARCGQRRRMK